MEHPREFDRLNQVEYGSRIEITLRLAGIILLCAAIYLGKGWSFVWIWLSIYLLMHLANFYMSRGNGEDIQSADLYISAIGFLAINASFLWLPAFLIIQDDKTLSHIGYLAVMIVLIFLVRRSDTLLFMVVGEVLIVAVLALFTLQAVNEYSGFLPIQIAATVVSVGLIAYLAHAILDARARRLQAEEAFRRSAQAQKMEAVGQLAGGVAHDFNNHLSVIMGNLELIADTQEDAEGRKLVEEALNSCTRSAELTKSLLSFSRQASLAPRILDLNEVVRDASSWIQRTLPANISVETSLLAGLWRTRIDPHALENALLNLVINARDSMPGGGSLTLETSNMRIDSAYNRSRGENLPIGRYVMLAVSDTGTGIPAENLDRIFEPFYTTKAVNSGSGLGLSSVMGFARQSGGTIRVYSEPGTGTTFKLYFPAALPDAGAADRTDPSPKRSATASARILVVEDNPNVLDLLSDFLSRAGHIVTTAPSGDIALEMFQEDPGVDLVVTDIVMPGRLKGTDLARALRQTAPELPIIFMSGYAREATVHGNGLLPDDIRLMKPVRRADLLNAVEQALAGTAGPHLRPQD